MLCQIASVLAGSASNIRLRKLLQSRINGFASFLEKNVMRQHALWCSVSVGYAVLWWPASSNFSFERVVETNLALLLLSAQSISFVNQRGSSDTIRSTIVSIIRYIAYT